MADEQPKSKKLEKPKGPSIFARIKNKIAQYRRVLSVARKPDRDEYFSTMKITASILIIVGSIGFIIFLLYYLVRGLVF